MSRLQHGHLVLTAVVVLSGVSACAQTALTPAERAELEMLSRQLAEPDRAAKTKREAALLLLSRTYPQAAAKVEQFLKDDSNRPAQIAVAEAIAESGQTRQEFVKPLLAMLTGPEPSVRTPAANALAAFKDPGVLDEFVKLVADRRTDPAARLVIIAAMQRILDKKAVDALIGLLDDPEEAIRNAACDSLAKLTSIPFGRDRGRWKSWWSANKQKPRSVWLADLADSLARANLQLDRENAALRRRLASAMNDLYAATPPAGRDALLIEMFKDPLAEVRLAAARLTQQRATNSQPLPEPLRAQVQARLTDPSPAVRREIALLLANVADAPAVRLLADRLKDENTPDVREAIYQGLGLLRDPKVWAQLVEGILKEEQRVAAAAAAALARVAEKGPVDDDSRSSAVSALKKRYEAAEGGDSADLREALLTAMGQLKEKRLADLFEKALKDPAATVRLSAIKALQSLAQGKSAAAVAPLTSDPDRSVRLAAITAVGALGGAEHLETVLARTDAHVEPDAAVRQQAWSVVMGLLEKADAKKLRLLADQLAGRQDAKDYLIQLFKLWASKIPADDVAEWAPVRLQLGEVLLAADRPAEAAAELAAVHAAMLKAGSSDAPRVWIKWVEAMLAADDLSAATRIAENTHEKQFAAAVEILANRVEALRAKKDWDGLVRLAGAASRQLRDRLSDSRRQWLQQALAEGLEQQRLADRQHVAALVPRLAGADETARTAAEKELVAMNSRALAPLLGELRKTLTGEGPDGIVERAILKLLAKLAPQLTGYALNAPAADRLAVVDGWLKKLGS
ncbi:MAG: hypothetical protein AMJ81_00515 [Phycisphaerae bacterium SM23_33]|nr:MAG: hypothetical protein AMJ81_00515 [Phycisphaerae bacterium SM23_33]